MLLSCSIMFYFEKFDLSENLDKKPTAKFFCDEVDLKKVKNVSPRYIQFEFSETRRQR